MRRSSALLETGTTSPADTLILIPSTSISKSPCGRTAVTIPSPSKSMNLTLSPILYCIFNVDFAGKYNKLFRIEPG